MGFPHDSYFKVPNAMLGSKTTPGWIREVGPIGFAVYSLILRRYDFRRHEGLYESHASMAKGLGISEPTLEKYLSKLLESGLIDRVPRGRRRHDQWTYVPRLPVPAPPRARAQQERNTQGDLVMNTQIDLAKTTGIPKLARKNTQNDEGASMKKVVVKVPDKPLTKPPKRLFKRLNKNMSLEDQVNEILASGDEVPLQTKLHVTWSLWCHLWEHHYHRPYYLAKRKENAQIIPKDKKNLRDKIEAVGFGEVVSRMRRCFDVCDKIFPCVVNGQWQRPIRLNDFINNHFFDQWIKPPLESTERAPRRGEDKVKAAMEKRNRAAGPGETDARRGG